MDIECLFIATFLWRGLHGILSHEIKTEARFVEEHFFITVKSARLCVFFLENEKSAEN